jgi:sec-independent protein translocase protein TatB
MFDVSFSELVLILVVGLIVFGPEKLPEVVRTTGLWIGKLRRSFNNIRSEIEREVGVEELRRDLHNQAIMDSLKGVQDDLRGAQQEIERLPYDVSKSVASETLGVRQPAQPAIATQSTIGDNADHTPNTTAGNIPGQANIPSATQPAPQQPPSS